MSRTISLTDFMALEGREIGCSDWVEVSQARIDAFADVTEDWQAIHLDPQAGATAGFGGTVAHGFLTVSMLSAMAYSALPQIEGQKASVNYGFDKLRFLEPVAAGTRLRGRFTLKSLEQRPDGAVMMVTAVQVEAENAPRPALVADWRILILLNEAAARGQ